MRRTDSAVVDAARAAGQSSYESPVPCPQGHIGRRRLSNHSCVECHRIHQRLRWRTHRKFTVLPEHKLWINARRRSRKQGLLFTITEADIRNVWPKDNRCPVLGIELRMGEGRGPKPHSPTLDRRKPGRGYIPENIAVISCKANLIKSDET